MPKHPEAITIDGRGGTLLYELTGEVIRGKGVGRTLGFPTANLSISHAGDLPHGVYAARVLIHCQWHSGLVNVGKHPTLPEGPPSIEAYIIGSFDDLYGQRITVQLTRFLREEKKFKSTEALRDQIQKDLLHLENNRSSKTAPQGGHCPP